MLGESFRGFSRGLIVDCYVGAGAGELFTDYGAEAAIRTDVLVIVHSLS